MEKSFESELRTKLVSKNVSVTDVDYILSLIHSSERDDNLKVMDNNVYELLDNRGLKTVFEDACNELGFIFSHSNDPEV